MVNWGILCRSSSQQIPLKFAKDLLIDPSTKGAHDVTHNLVAVASSTSLQKAQDFLSAVNAPPSTAAYGSYESLLADPTVEIVYISTPHSHHYQNARAALLAGKHVLLEKAFTVNAAQARILVQLAREKKLFLMEAMWTRFFPLTFPPASGTSKPAPHVSGSLVKYAPTGVDETATVIVTFPESKTQGVATASLRVASDPTDPGVRIFGDKGQIQIFGPAARPLSIAVVTYGEGGPEVVERKDFEIPVGHGLFWEADACARYLAKGETESDVMPLDETLLIMDVMDRVREENSLRYPAEVEGH
ncbi:unnamed protein product [Aspergillus oryzae]|uniref:D-xylose 1-dehydrogenase (NADP(+), D-xylono-1,5-lactone-forming) n=2 Tax=Aspergillus oryzae TaxID=5062 RepID=A0AAN5BW44_ASPOZ|nr:unnamed protein product [Aspergillus oryzae]GMF86406.1 unnamed protein product [Aspergillus oryzae]GMG27424.1 unnamed protein product [Aspergillus oryzae]GMG40931.1 unnamed protein product [Aspergillus oryzae var. brunneus]